MRTIPRRTLLRHRRRALPGLSLAREQGKPTLKIGCLTDMSGPYKDLAGPGAVARRQSGAG